jgi:hypothetical protein
MLLLDGSSSFPYFPYEQKAAQERAASLLVRQRSHGRRGVSHTFRIVLLPVLNMPLMS